MIGVVESIDSDGVRVQSAVLRFPRRSGGGDDRLLHVTAHERIGQGSFGTVYRATCDGYPMLAMKIATGKTSRLRQELGVLAKVCTKGRLLLPRFEFGALNAAEDLMIVGMELCVPSTLHDFLLGTRMEGERDILFVAHQVLQAVLAVHEEGCIHRDVKLQNFVFDQAGNVKLIDFGLASVTSTPAAGDVVAGTVSFMAPEMAHNVLSIGQRLSVGAAADVWAVGIVLFSLFTRCNPYPHCAEAVEPAAAAASVRDPVALQAGGHAPPATGSLRGCESLLRLVAAGEWRWPRRLDISSDLRRLVERILVRDPAARPTIRELLDFPVWRQRLRSPPSAVLEFLGLQDDLLMSRDEQYLLRAVEQRSADVTASLMGSRRPSPDAAAAAEELGPRGDSIELATGDSLAFRGRRGGLVVEPADDVEDLEGVGNMSSHHLHDTRQSGRRGKKPIREISLVILEETEKKKVSRRGSRVGSRIGSRATSRAVSLSLVAEPSLDVVRSDVPPKVEMPAAAAESAASASSQRRVESREDTPPSTVSLKKSRTSPPVGGSVSESASAMRVGTATTPIRKSQVSSQQSNSHMGEPIGPERLIGMVERLGHSQGSLTDPLVTCSASAASGTTHAAAETSSAVPHRVSMAATPSDPGSSRGCVAAATDPFLSDSAVFVRPARRRRPSERQRSATRTAARKSSLGATAAPPAEGERWERVSGARGGPSRGNARSLRVGLLRASPTTVVHYATTEGVSRVEAASRGYIQRLLLLEQEWLLASLRLVIEEDQGRFNVVWLAGEQARSASHPHQFRYFRTVPNDTYRDGFVCDICSGDFAPGGKRRVELHFYHCECGRDLCVPCHTAYASRCTCELCGRKLRNSVAYRDHQCVKRPRRVDGSDGEDGVSFAAPRRTRARHASRTSLEPAVGVTPTASRRSLIDTPDVASRAMEAMDPGVFDRPLNVAEAGPWRPFAKLQAALAANAVAQPTPEERRIILEGEWIRHFHLFPVTAADPVAFTYHIQPGRTGAIFLSNEFTIHSAVVSVLERQMLVVDSIDTTDGYDVTHALSLMHAKSSEELRAPFLLLQDVVAYDCNMMKQHRAPGTLSVYQAPQSAYRCHGNPFVYVRWFRFSHDRTMSAFLLSTGAVQVFVEGKYELRWVDEARKFLVRSNGMCEAIDEEAFILSPAVNHLLYDTIGE